MKLAQPPLKGRDFRRMFDAALKEPQWQNQVEQALDAYRWWWMHIPANVVVCSRCGFKNYRGIKKGFPDILAIKPPYLLWIELKTESGQLKPEQRHMREMLEGCGQVFIHARPRDRERLFGWIANPETWSGVHATRARAGER